ncbi:MAG: dihydrolipoyllysine-residue succinyltransferase [Rhodospirillaceae bacterium]|nr:dihydrolipoyllysine-residue succinyltransferase [Rhodospirillaceae bacterium]|tara:strand:- start:11953 stop:13179 length:1227 start_codon:yes stop_codon:yes gene_type:complete
MPIEIKVPPLGESVVEATVAKWIKKKGDPVKVDEPIVELETDKVTLEVPSPTDGIIANVLVSEGSSVEVENVLAILDESNKTILEDQTLDLEQNKPQEQINLSSESNINNELSPAVRRLVEEHKLDPSSIKGSGKDGRLTKGDILSNLISKDKIQKNNISDTAIISNNNKPSPNKDDREKRVPMSKIRKIIAHRLKEAQNTAAMLTTFNEVDMTAVINLRNEFKDDFLKNHNIKLGFMSFFVKASIISLEEFPAVNAEIVDDEIIYKNYYNIGVAVGTPQGLVVPVLKDAQDKNIAQIENEIANFAFKAREGKLLPSDLNGGTFTISNGGIYGSLMSTPILNRPQSGILGMHKIQKRPIAIGDNIEIRPMMYLALSYDHRIIDGREAVSFLIRIKESIEDPRRILLNI